MTLAGEIVFLLAKRRVARQAAEATVVKPELPRSNSYSVGENPASFSMQTYAAWRTSELRKQYTDHFPIAELQNRDVLDFGCGEGALSFLASESGAKSVIGMDLSEARIASARQQASVCQLATIPRFVVADSPTEIALPSDSSDVILCFDVLEHIMEYEKIIREWKRVLRPGGRVLIWWIPWWHPYGPHVESLVPVPWAHVFCSDRELIRACERVYDLPAFKPRLWDLDQNGMKKPNKWAAMDTLPEVNKLTMHAFEELCRDVGFAISTRKLKGFGSSTLGKLTHPLLAVPYIKEFVTSCVTYQLYKSR